MLLGAPGIATSNKQLGILLLGPMMVPHVAHDLLGPGRVGPPCVGVVRRRRQRGTRIPRMVPWNRNKRNRRTLLGAKGIATRSNRHRY